MNLAGNLKLPNPFSEAGGEVLFRYTSEVLIDDTTEGVPALITDPSQVRFKFWEQPEVAWSQIWTARWMRFQTG